MTILHTVLYVHIFTMKCELMLMLSYLAHCIDSDFGNVLLAISSVINLLIRKVMGEVNCCLFIIIWIELRYSTILMICIFILTSLMLSFCYLDLLMLSYGKSLISSHSQKLILSIHHYLFWLMVLITWYKESYFKMLFKIYQ